MFPEGQPQVDAVDVDSVSSEPPPQEALAWIPVTGSAMRRCGVDFDAVRVKGLLGQETYNGLTALNGPDCGAVIYTQRSDGYHFLVPPGAAASVRWPPGVWAGTSSRHGAQEQYIVVPALRGDTGSARWISRPGDSLFVDAQQLQSLLCRITGWCPRTDDRPTKPSQRGGAS
ncbi:hypothetical protein ACFU99_17520 [Streptomyces sp. NPDC057654]|uniref:hypothetical protein n=1 Tax=Streptomyces sp. NPDC057654 TaxID=3346196 RepID=UPI0036CDB4C5